MNTTIIELDNDRLLVSFDIVSVNGMDSVFELSHIKLESLKLLLGDKVHTLRLRVLIPVGENDYRLGDDVVSKLESMGITSRLQKFNDSVFVRLFELEFDNKLDGYKFITKLRLKNVKK